MLLPFFAMLFSKTKNNEIYIIFTIFFFIVFHNLQVKYKLLFSFVPNLLPLITLCP